MAYELNLTPLERAVTALEAAMAEYHKSTPASGLVHEMMRDSVIQRFEFTHELSRTVMKKFFDIYQSFEDISTVKGLYRAAAKAGLIEDGERWMGYLKLRNLSVHTYDSETADLVVEQLRDFPADVRFLLSQLRINLS